MMEEKMLKSEKRNALTIVLFAVYMLLLTGIILFKLPFRGGLSDGVRVINLIPFGGSFDENGNLILREIIDNILIFAPPGVYISMLKNDSPFVKKALPIIGLSLMFEVTQFVFAIGRSDITDVIDNMLGGIIGIGIYALLLKIFKGRTVAIVNVLALIVTVCVVLRFAHLFYLSHFVMRRLRP
jgi:glycopeptide antibiotics resistance protein